MLEERRASPSEVDEQRLGEGSTLGVARWLIEQVNSLKESSWGNSMPCWVVRLWRRPPLHRSSRLPDRKQASFAESTDRSSSLACTSGDLALQIRDFNPASILQHSPQCLSTKKASPTTESSFAEHLPSPASTSSVYHGLQIPVFQQRTRSTIATRAPPDMISSCLFTARGDRWSRRPKRR